MRALRCSGAGECSRAGGASAHRGGQQVPVPGAAPKSPGPAKAATTTRAGSRARRAHRSWVAAEPAAAPAGSHAQIFGTYRHGVQS
jgi:hypothetical protein